MYVWQCSQTLLLVFDGVHDCFCALKIVKGNLPCSVSRIMHEGIGLKAAQQPFSMLVAGLTRLC